MTGQKITPTRTTTPSSTTRTISSANATATAMMSSSTIQTGAPMAERWLNGILREPDGDTAMMGTGATMVFRMGQRPVPASGGDARGDRGRRIHRGTAGGITRGQSEQQEITHGRQFTSVATFDAMEQTPNRSAA